MAPQIYLVCYDMYTLDDNNYCGGYQEMMSSLMAA